MKLLKLTAFFGIFLFAINIYSGFNSFSSNRFPLTQINQIAGIATDTNQFLFTAPYGLGLIHVDNWGTINAFRQWGFDEMVISPQLFTDDMIYIYNPDLNGGGTASVYRTDMYTQVTTAMYNENTDHLYGQITYETVDDTFATHIRTYVVSSGGRIKVLNENMVYQSQTDQLLFEISSANIKIVRHPQIDGIFYLMQHHTNMIYLVDVRSYYGYHDSPQITEAISASASEVFIDIATIWDTNTTRWYLVAARDDNYLNVYSIDVAVGDELSPAFVNSEDYYSHTSTHPDHITAIDNNVILLCSATDKLYYFDIFDTATWNNIDISSDEYTGIFASPDKLFLMRNNLDPLLLNCSDYPPAVSDYTFYDVFFDYDVEIKETPNYYVGVNSYGTVQYYSKANMAAPERYGTFVAYTKHTQSDTSYRTVSFDTDADFDRIVVRNGWGMSTWTLDHNGSIIELTRHFYDAVLENEKEDLALCNGRIFMPCDTGVVVIGCQGPDTAEAGIFLNARPDHVVADKGRNIILGCYDDGTDKLFLASATSYNVHYNSFTPDSTSIANQFEIDGDLPVIWVLEEGPAINISRFSYDDPMSPQYDLTVQSQNSVAHFGAGGGKLFYRDTNGILNAITPGNAAQPVNLLEYISISEPWEMPFCVFGGKYILANSACGDYSIWEYASSASTGEGGFNPYPNPTTGQVTIDNLQPGTRVELRTADGWLVHEWDIDESGQFSEDITVSFYDKFDHYNISFGKYFLIIKPRDGGEPIVRVVYIARP
ncbi:hypothetical protein KAU32_01425 [bacterium]|nr:hypothetical protein [bacterium]